MSAPAQRRNILDLIKSDPDELKRFAKALNNLKTDPSASAELYALNAIHGGGFPAQFQANIAPYVDWYISELGPNSLSATDSKKDWSGNAFCAHSISLFFIWHRPYMRCFELLLQKNDPNKGSNGPLAAHYWAWDHEYKDTQHPVSLPTLFTDSKYFDSMEKGMANPFVSGTLPEYLLNDKYKVGNLNYFKRYRDSHGNTTRGKYEGIAKTKVVEVVSCYDSSLEYADISTTNGQSTGDNFEDPHNALHGAVGGAMGVPITASWDPIFWLHHSNVERMQYAYLDMYKGRAVTILDDNYNRNKPITLNTHLYPFPSRATFASQGTGALPWARPANANDLSTVTQWISNDNLGYSYDHYQLSDFGIRVSSRLLLMATPGASTKNAVKKIFTIKNVDARGTGIVKGQIKIGNDLVELDEKHIFTFDKQAVCANCAARILTLSWNLHLTPEQAANANANDTSVVSLTFNDDDITTGIEPAWFDKPTRTTTVLRNAVTRVDAAVTPSTKSQATKKVVKSARKVVKKVTPAKKDKK